MATCERPDTTIHYQDSGGDGPVLLLSHGFLMDHTMFDPQVEEFAPAYRCIRWDERGFGETPAPGPFTYWDSADDAMAVLDACDVDWAVLIGMSQGGFLSLRAALRYPDRVAGLVLVDSAADVDDAATLEGYQGMLDAVEHGSDADRAAVFTMIAGLILGEEELAAEWIPTWERMDRSQIVTAGAALLGREDISDRLEEIRCPVLVVHGTRDEAISLERARAVCDAVPDCRGVVEVEGAAHAANLSHPEPVNAAIGPFLDRL